VFSWALIGLGAVLWGRGPVGTRFRRLWPAAAGPAALALCIPFYLGQRGTLTVPTWLPELSFPVLGTFATLLFDQLSPIIVLVVSSLAYLSGRPHSRQPGDAEPRRYADEIGGILLCMGFPLILVVFSITVQPAILRRYAVVTFLCFPPIAALLAARCPRGLPAATCLLLLVYSTSVLYATKLKFRKDLARLTSVINQTRALPADAPILVMSRHTLYPLSRVPPSLADRCGYLDFEERPAGMYDALVLERDMARSHGRLYGFPTMVPLATARQWQHFYVVGARKDESWLPYFFKRHKITPQSKSVFLVERLPQTDDGSGSRPVLR